MRVLQRALTRWLWTVSILSLLLHLFLLFVDIIYKWATNAFNTDDLLPARVPCEGNIKDTENLRVPGIVDMEACVDSVKTALALPENVLKKLDVVEKELKETKESTEALDGFDSRLSTMEGVLSLVSENVGKLVSHCSTVSKTWKRKEKEDIESAKKKKKT